MPVVFVHGVNTRKGPGYDAQVLVIDRFVQKHLAGVTINGHTMPAPVTRFPYWGDLGMTFAWNMASLPRSGIQALGGSADSDLQVLMGQLRDALDELPQGEPLVALAKKDFPLAVDAIIQLALANAAAGDSQEVADFVVAASSYADATPKPAWLAGVTTDQALITRLSVEIQPVVSVQSMGGLGTVVAKLKLGAMKLKQAVVNAQGTAIDRAGDFASTKLLASTRNRLNETLGRFFGDIFIYFNSRGDAANPGPIPKRIMQEYDASRLAVPNEPFIVIGHSLGGVISMDLLGHFRPDIQVDLFVTVGSQVAHFEEMKLYKNSDVNVRTPNLAHTPPNVKHWINIFDEVDVFSYCADSVFDRVDVDAAYDTKTYTTKAHSAYLNQDGFYQRLRARIDSL